jgi:hypothetical protein
MRRIRNFFTRFEVNLSEYESYSLHILMFRYIRKHHLFASFSLQNIPTNTHTNIQVDTKQIHVEANICFRENIRFTFSHIGEYSLQNICFEANMAKLQANFYFQANIRFRFYSFACKLC